ncbi:cytochrome P450 [Bimuria novae-zelandiae CBS 107.79]|uniref:Cytochrome P450 n=1 Tax=Bimuria novae-zelandiae CBS 107.79 TaxID=1447943 RepID=A0A6A5VNA9_9PLEO|nr:cytochrome P450 [Bimuria novae-zelandiae CBS 107.79]
MSSIVKILVLSCPSRLTAQGFFGARRSINLNRTLVHSDLPPSEKTFDRIRQEVSTVTGAAFEITASALRVIMYHIYTNDKIFQRLNEELATVAMDYSLKQLEQLPYLTAVLTEGMRLSPAVASRAACTTNKDLFYKDWRIPAGTPVGMTTLLMNTDESLYPDPTRFDPDRWLASKTAGSEARKSLVWAEMYLLIAAIVPKFRFNIEGAKASDFELESDNFSIGTKAGCNLVVL